MSNLRFEFQDSYSINALVLLSFGFEQFDHHKPKLILANDISRFITNRKVIVNNDDDDDDDVFDISKVTVTSITSTGILNLPIDDEKDAITLLSSRRAEIKKAIHKNILQIDKLDTKDCDEIRIQSSSAKLWLKSMERKIPTSQHSKDWRKERKENSLLTIAILKKLLQADNYSQLANKIIENSEGILNDMDSQTFAKLLAEADGKLKEKKQVI